MTADSTDIAKKEQLDICLQWVDQNLEFHEDLFYPHPLPNTKADTINKFILDLIKKMDLNIRNTRHHSYDGRSTRSVQNRELYLKRPP